VISSRSRRRAALGVAALTALLVPGLAQLPALAAPPSSSTSGVLPSAGTVVPDEVRTLGDPVAGLLDVDLRGTARPTQSQLGAALRLPATVRWNDFGTPSSIAPRSGSGGLAAATSADPVAAARAYLARNAGVLGLTSSAVAGLDLVNDQEMVGSDGHAVLFRQRFGDLTPALGSMVTVGVANGEIAYVSSSLTRTTQAPPAAVLDPLQGWLKAAADTGLDLPAGALADIATETTDDGWTRLKVPGLVQEQQARVRALALADGSVRPVVEANVVDVEGGNAEAYTVMVDAVTGKALHRENQVENASDAYPFTGEVTATSCGPEHAFTLDDDDTRTITAVGTALNPSNDITLTLRKGAGGPILASEDLLTSPEALTYSADSIPAGEYTLQVCPFEGSTFLPPGNYALNVVTSDVASGGAGGGVPTHSPRWRFFTANPTLDSPTQTPTNSVIGCWFKAAAGCTLPTGALRNVQAPGPWDTIPTTGTSTGTSVGNNANTHEAWASPLTPGGTFQAPVSATGDYTTPFTDAWNNSGCNPAELTPGGNDIIASVTNLFSTHNRMHDYSYYLGFNEENYNLQTSNVGRGGAQGDPEIGNAQAGAIGGVQTGMGRDNANQIALQDGVPGITNQYLFQPLAGAFYAPCTDGGLDMGIVGHEYTHAISNRMVGGPDEGLTSEHGGAMGESWSDLVAAEYQYSHGYSNGGNIWAVGAYATGNKDVAIRDYAINKNPLNFGDYGFDTTGPEVHADGEIWNGTNWEVRQALVDKWNAKFPYANKTLQLKCAQGGPNKGVVRPQMCPGNRRWVQLMFDAFLLQQGATSMLDARDAFIAADRMRFRGENNKVIWDAFSRRGMGRDASTPDADSEAVTPSFVSPTSANTKVTFKTGGAGKVYVGDYEARATPVADTLGSTPLGSSARFTPGTYRMVYASAKNGFTRFTMKVTGQGTKTVKIADTPNLAAAASGAKVLRSTAGSINAEALIDGTEGASWAAVTDGVNVDESRPSIDVDLAGGTHTVRRVQVSAMLAPATDADPDAGSRFTALRRFAIEACTSGCGGAGATYKRVFTSPVDAFPGVRPRPVAPNLTMRSFAIPATKAQALRLVVLENQCTGFAGYAGEQDDDPTNDTDCKTASDRGTIAHTAELQAFS